MNGSIGKYQLQAEIGRGGFGIVYKAFDPTVNRTVAIKVLTVHTDKDLLTRFRNEAAAAGNLNHPNIVTVHEFGESADGLAYMVMQYLQGETLGSMLRQRKPVTLLQKMNVMWQVAEGLHHAHQRGVIHRDVKPPNIMVLPDESVQIMDFGIARMKTSTTHQTRTGFVVGTPLYMAPEQFLSGKTVDHRVDIWSLGVIYYEFLTGRHPFAAPEDTTILYQIAHVEPPPVRTLAPDVPAALEDIVHRALIKDPEFRYANLRELQYDAQPIMFELRRERAIELLVDAQRLASDEHFDEAQDVLQQIIQLDSANIDAQSLLRSVKQQLVRRQVQPRIDSLLIKAEEESGKRNFAAALQALESAAKLSNTDPNIRLRLDHVRTLLDHSRECERLVADAQRQLRARNLTDALRMVSEAVEVDPGNTTAGKLLSEIQREIEAREANRRVEDGVSDARGLMLLHQYEEAIALLTNLVQSGAEHPAIAEMLETARKERSEQERREARTRQVNTAREFLRTRKFSHAVSVLGELSGEFPGDAEIQQLLQYARDEQAHQLRSDAVAHIVQQAERLRSEERFDEALRIVESGISEHPGEPALERTAQSITVARAAAHRRSAIERCLAECAKLRVERQLPVALQRVKAAIAEFGEEPALRQLRADLEQDIGIAAQAVAAAVVSAPTPVHPPPPPEPEPRQAAVTDQGPPPVPQQPGTSRGVVFGAVAAAVVLGVIGAAVYQQSRRAPTAPAQPPVTVAQSKVEPLATTPPASSPIEKPKPTPPVKPAAKQEPPRTLPVPEESAPEPAEPAPAQPAPTQPEQSRPLVGDTGPRAGLVTDAGPRSSTSSYDPVQPGGLVKDSGPTQRVPPGQGDRWSGPVNGSLAWSGGALPANGRLILSTSRVLEGGGQLKADTMPPFGKVDLHVVSPKGKVAVSPFGANSIVVTNTSGVPIYFVQLNWELKPE